MLQRHDRVVVISKEEAEWEENWHRKLDERTQPKGIFWSVFLFVAFFVVITVVGIILLERE